MPRIPGQARAYVCPGCGRSDDGPRTAEALDEMRTALGLLAAATPMQVAYHVKCNVIDRLESHRKYIEIWFRVGDVEKRLRDVLDQYDEPGCPKLERLVDDLLDQHTKNRAALSALREYLDAADGPDTESAYVRLCNAAREIGWER